MIKNVKSNEERSMPIALDDVEPIKEEVIRILKPVTEYGFTFFYK